jgi:hypothetical protein
MRGGLTCSLVERCQLFGVNFVFFSITEGYYAMWPGRFIPAFWRNMLLSLLGYKKGCDAVQSGIYR